MEKNRIVSHAAWIRARKALLAKEKAFTRAWDRLSRLRRKMPWERVAKNYVFKTPDGERSLADLFEGRHQLIVYHFMFDPSWQAGCKSCSFWADNFDGIVTHLNQRDVSLVAISRAPLSKLSAFKKRMGWNLELLSSFGSDFNFDYGVSFNADDLANGAVTYNYAKRKTSMSELPGVTVFYRDSAGEIFHTYSCYSRGLDMLNGAYHLLDLVPKGRDEDDLPYPMVWVRLRDEYGDEHATPDDRDAGKRVSRHR